MINYHEPTPFLILYSLLLYICVIVYNWNIINKRNFCIGEKDRIITKIFFLVLLFAVTPFFSGDFYHYIEWVEEANVQWNIDALSRIEVAYQYISSFVDGSYFPFRIIVWGSEILLICYTARRLNISIKLSLYLIILLFPVLYAYARASLAMAIYFYGLSYLLNPSKFKILSYAIGLVIIFVCPLFHRSMYFLLAITPLILLPIFFSIRSKWKMIFYTIAVILSVYMFSKILMFLDLTEIIGDETLQEKLNSYSEREKGEAGPAGMLKKILEMTFRWGSVLLFYKYCLSKIQEKHTIVEKLFVFSVTILLIGLSFSYCGDEFFTLSYRISAMYFIPFTLMVAYSYQCGFIKPRYIKYICFLAIICNLYLLFYSVYISIVT